MRSRESSNILSRRISLMRNERGALNSDLSITLCQSVTSDFIKLPLS
jgi:hypothetical protein